MSDERTPLGVLLWFGWALVLLAITGLLLPKIIDFVDFSPRAPFSLLGLAGSAAAGWYILFVPIGLVISAVLVGLLLRRSARAYFSED